MSILVKGMRMPKSCSYCDFYNMHLVRCTRIPKWLEIDVCNYRDKECPIVEVSATYGRLIDADALIESFNAMEQTQIIKLIKSLIDLQPTVIEGE